MCAFYYRYYLSLFAYFLHASKVCFFRNCFFSEICLCGHNIPYSAWRNIDLLSDFSFFRAQFVSSYCRHVSDIKTYMTIIMLEVLVVTCMVSVFTLSPLPLLPSSIALPGPAEKQS